MSGAASIALVGLFALAITPGDGPITVSSSTVTPAAFASSPVSITTVANASPVATTLPGERSVLLVSSSKAVTSGPRTVGESHTTVWISERITAQALLMAEVGGVAVVDLDDDTKGRDLGLPQYLVATSVPDPHDEVTVMIDGVPHIVPFDEVASLDVEPGTAIFDRTGRLIALCDHGGDPIVIVPPPVTTTTVPPAVSVPDTTTVPPSTDPVTSTTTPATTTTTSSTTTTEPSTTTTTTTTTTTEPSTTTTNPPTTTRPPTTTTHPPTTTTDPPTTTTRPATTTTTPPVTTTTDAPTTVGED